MQKLNFLLTCLKWYPKLFNFTIIIYKDGYLKYRRHDNSRLFTIHLLGPIKAIVQLDNC